MTREVHRSSLRVASGVKEPEEVYMKDGKRGWSRMEIRGGDWH